MTSAVGELPTLSPIRQRAMLTYLDQKANDEGYLIRATEEVCRAILDTGLDKVTEVNNGPAQFVLFMVDDLKFKMAVGSRKTEAGSTSNESVEGIHEEETRKLYAFVGTGWKEIVSLADLGQWIK